MTPFPCDFSCFIQLPGQFFPTVAMNKFLSDVKDSFTQAVLAKLFASMKRLKCCRVTKARQPGEILLDSVQNKGYTCMCQQLTIVTEPFCSQFPSFSKVRSMSSVSSQCWKLKKLEPGRHLRPCVRKILWGWCCCVTTSRKPLWLRLRFAARLSNACCSASIHNRSMTFSRVLDFCYASRGQFSHKSAKLRQPPFGRCFPPKSKRHRSHEQQMMIQAEWNQRSVSHGVTLPWPLSP